MATPLLMAHAPVRARGDDVQELLFLGGGRPYRCRITNHAARQIIPLTDSFVLRAKEPVTHPAGSRGLRPSSGGLGAGIGETLLPTPFVKVCKVRCWLGQMRAVCLTKKIVARLILQRAVGRPAEANVRIQRPAGATGDGAESSVRGVTWAAEGERRGRIAAARGACGAPTASACLQRSI
jgi:hypothetical protein